jgi:hypothetical protein
VYIEGYEYVSREGYNIDREQHFRRDICSIIAYNDAFFLLVGVNILVEGVFSLLLVIIMHFFVGQGEILLWVSYLVVHKMFDEMLTPQLYE